MRLRKKLHIAVYNATLLQQNKTRHFRQQSISFKFWSLIGFVKSHHLTSPLTQMCCEAYLNLPKSRATRISCAPNLRRDKLLFPCFNANTGSHQLMNYQLILTSKGMLLQETMILHKHPLSNNMKRCLKDE